MPRHYDERDDYADRDRPPPRPGMSPAMIVLIVLGAVGVLGLFLCGGGLAYLLWPVGPRPVGGPAAVQVGPADTAVKEGDISKQRETAAAKRVYPRDEFQALVMGKTPDEVRAALGDSDRTDDGRGRPVWTYRGRTKDPATGKADAAAFVQFARGAVIEVRY